VVFWNTKRLQVVDDSSVQIALCIKRAPRKSINADVSIKIWFLSGWWICKAVRFVNDKANIRRCRKIFGARLFKFSPRRES
jgi:hypothetical protein